MLVAVLRGYVFFEGRGRMIFAYVVQITALLLIATIFVLCVGAIVTS